ncbi:hypothetical protein [Vibrio porteresiae]|uniref:Uncharacterized protein n=1 Tax=Vibrio porteresiae DSM 19223 TaxID=1123496 RepID=A0ABZ0Q8Z2_9VIBR|nr:hypothetical protein [Vibrio porteresiae]WPC72908.1 hypothetical protein R8Z52_12310 [Vibrio porteresiae DSM 19223]
MSVPFSYYFNGVRQTSTEEAFLINLTKDCEDPEAVMEGILESKKRYENDESQE